VYYWTNVQWTKSEIVRNWIGGSVSVACEIGVYVASEWCGKVYDAIWNLRHLSPHSFGG